MIKTKILFLFFLVICVGILLKLAYLQLFRTPNNYSQYLRTQRLQAERGRLYDRNHQPLVVNEIAYQLYAEPKKVDKPALLIRAIDSVLKVGEATLESRLNMTKEWVSLATRVNTEQKQQLEDLKLNGLGFQDQFQRYYPESSIAAHLTGFVGKDQEGKDIGYFGIEGFYDKDLSGLPGVFKSERDLLGRPILFGLQEKTDSEDGRDLLLTIDKSVQEIVKRRLVSGLERYKAKDGCIIVANPNTMEILALTCLPDFDPEHYYEFGEDYFKNPAISNLYEPGSTFKPLVLAAALQENAVKASDTFDESGPVENSGFTIRTWNNKYEGKISMSRIIERSSNVGMVYLGEKLGKDRLYKYVRDLGFGQYTNIDLQGEVSGNLRPQNSWYPIDFATVTFGQGIGVTPMQMITAFASVINGGKLMRPYTVLKTVGGEIEHQREPREIRQVFSEETSKIMRQVLYNTVEHGEFKWAKPAGYKFGGKTGTAQIAVDGTYDATKTVASFMGFAPVENPQFLALVILHEPGSSQWGSETAAPLFFEIAKDLLVYYNIAPDN